MKRTLIYIFAAAALLLCAGAAGETAEQACREVIETAAVPMAAANDTGAAVNKVYSAEELAELICALEEKGIVPEENNELMQALQNGHGFYEEEAMMEICRLGFGGYHYTWTLEDQDWYEQMLVKAGLRDAPEIRMPGRENMSCEEAEAFAFRKIREEFGEDLPLEDRTAWELERLFSAASGESASWYFELIPRDPDRSGYTVSFEDGNPEETVFADEVSADPELRGSGESVMDKFEEVYKVFRGNWTQETWQRLHETMLDAEPDPGELYYPEYLGYQMTSYPEPAEGDVSREEAVRIAKKALNREKAALDSAVLTEYEGSRIWLVTLGIFDWYDGKEDPEAGSWTVAVDSRSGKTESIRGTGEDGEHFMAYVHPAAYEKCMEGRLSDADYLRIAAEAIREQYPEVDPLDGNEYEAGERLICGNAREIVFRTKTIRHGDASATVSADGTAAEVTADPAEADGDTLFGRYRQVYGYFGEWEQDIWTRLGRDMQALDPAETEGRLLKSTRFPEENSVRIRSAEAKELALKAVGKHMSEVNTCVLADAEPNPVWIMRVLTYDEDYDPVIGIDAETGEVMFTERYYVDETPQYELFTTPETRRSFLSAPYLARNAVIFTYARDLDDPETDVLNTADWEMKQEGLAVRFTGRWKGMKAYEVELDPDGNVLRCERSDSPSAEEKPELPEDGGEEALPTPQPDGKPWIWGNPFAPAEYWDQLAAAMERNGVTFGNLKDKVFEWTREYGWTDDADWPQEKFAIAFVLTELRPDYIPEGESVDYPVFPDPGKKTQAEIEEIAVKAFCEAAEPVTGAAWAGRLQPAARLWNTGNYEFYGVEWPEPAWHVSFLELDEVWEERGIVMLDEDGNILTVQVEPFTGG